MFDEKQSPGQTPCKPFPGLLYRNEGKSPDDPGDTQFFSAKATASPTGTRKPFFSFSTISRQPGASVVIMGRAIDAASRRPRGVPSRQLGRTMRSTSVISCCIFSTWPSTVNRSEFLPSPYVLLRYRTGIPRIRSPGKQELKFIARWANNSAASAYSLIPFSQSSRAASKTRNLLLPLLLPLCTGAKTLGIHPGTSNQMNAFRHNQFMLKKEPLIIRILENQAAPFSP